MPTDYKIIAEENVIKYGTDIGRYGTVLLANLYSKRTHFIYEILQNAEDAGAKINKKIFVRFHLFEDRLEVRHNGKLFDEDDVRGICGLVEGTKKEDLTQIGKFGIGFKSVYAYTSTPKIYSGNEAFCIENYVLPHSVDRINLQDDATLFIFPFNHKDVSHEQAFKAISKRLRGMGARTLLFLNYIEEIEWYINDQESGNYIRDIKAWENHKRVYVISKVQEENVEDEEWLIFEKPLKSIGDIAELKVEVAFKIERDKDNNEIIVPAGDSKLIVFFPTEKPTYLNFLIQGPYKTTPNRESIPLDNEENQSIIDETGILVAESMPIIKKLKLLNAEFLQILPIENIHNDEPIYSVVYQNVKGKLLSEEELIPNNTESHTSAAKAVLAGVKELTDLLTTADLDILFGKQIWLDTNITYDKTRDLWNYLVNELSIEDVDFEDFAKKISVEFIQGKDDQWLMKFYGSLLDRPALWREREKYKSPGVLREKPIIRLSNNNNIAPFDSKGKIHVYLPTESASEYKIVKECLTKNENSLKFLKALGLTKPDMFAEIREFIFPKYREMSTLIDSEEYYEDIEKILTAYEKIAPDKKEQFIADIKNIQIINSFNFETDQTLPKKPTEVYILAPDLKEYFKGHNQTYFVSTDLIDKFGKDKLNKFLLEIGCASKPRRIKFKVDLKWNQKRELRGNSGCTYDIATSDYKYDGLSNFLTNITVERSYILWRLLLKSLLLFPNWNKAYFFQGTYTWFYYSQNSRNFDSKILRDLKNALWLVDINDNLKKPSEITQSELSEEYFSDDPVINVLIEVLGFRIDEIKAIEEKTGGKFIPKDEVQDYEIWKAKKQIQKEVDKENEEWEPKCKPDEAEIHIEEVKPEILQPPSLEGQEPTGDNAAENTGAESSNESGSETSVEPSKKLKIIGEWGESLVFTALMDRFKDKDIEQTEFGFCVSDQNEGNIEIIWLNKNSDQGKGYDLVIKKDGIDNEYIEVKSKTSNEPELISITGIQWEFARKLFNEGKGDKYLIYTVVNACTHDPEIKIIRNPIKLWKDGKLYAHPINFKL